MTARQLKNSILQMAVQGKLAPQDPSDEPASVLLEKIRAEKRKLVEEGKIKKDKLESRIFRGSSEIEGTSPGRFYEQIGKGAPVDITDELPFEIPASWEWVRFGNITINKDGDRIPLSASSRIQLAKTYDYYGASGVIDKVDKFIFDKPLLLIGEDGANLLSRSTPIAFIARGKYWVNNHAHVIDAHNITLLEYLELFINSISLAPYVTGTAQPKMNQSKLNSIYVAVPPLEEQKKIISKIGQLLLQISDYEKTETQLRQLNASFPAKLKKSILQSAIKGQLVPQNPDDEPASVLLERIRTERRKFVEEGKLKKDKTESRIFRGASEIEGTKAGRFYEQTGNAAPVDITDELPFEIPESWEWARLASILLKYTDGAHHTPKYSSTGIPFLSVKDISSGKIDFSNCKYINPQDHKVLYKRCNPEIDNILLTKVGTTGIPVLINTDREFSIFVSLALLKFNTLHIDKYYLLYLLQSPLVQLQAKKNTKGVGNKNWVMKDIANTLINIPSLPEQQRIVAALDQLLPKIGICESLNKLDF